MTRKIMVHGYGMEDVAMIVRALSDALGQPIGFISACGRGSEHVSDILSKAPREPLTDAQPKVLMFIDFDDDSIYDSMMAFPDGGGIERPIFCMPTDDNVTWSLSQLLEHLEAERGG